MSMLMNNILTRWRDYLLNEDVIRGRALEHYTTGLSRKIVNVLKEDEVRELIATKGEVDFELVADELLDDLDWVNSVVVNVSTSDYIDVVGSYEYSTRASNEDREDSDIIINIVIPVDFSDHDFSVLIPELKDTLRHELEHSSQSTDVLSNIDDVIPAEDDGHVWSSIESADRYYNSQSETEAHVAGLYKRAKMLNKPASQVIDKFLDDILDMGTHYGHNENDVTKLISKIRKQWFDYLISRYPNANIGNYGKFEPEQ